MDGASALIGAVWDDCPQRAIRPIESLATPAERNAEIVAAGAALVCSDAMTCARAIACRLAVTDILDSLSRRSG